VIFTLLRENFKPTHILEKVKREYRFTVGKTQVYELRKIAGIAPLACSNVKRRNSGRHKKMTKREERTLVRFVKENRRIPVRMVTKLFCEYASITVCATTVWNTLQASGVLRLRPPRKPMLTPEHIAARKAFAMSHLHWTTEWDDIIFSDEKKFNMYGSDGNLYLWVSAAEKDSDIRNVPSVNFPESVMVWACFSSRGLGGLYIVPKSETVDSNTYIDILSQSLIPTIRVQFGGNRRRVIFQHINHMRATP